MKLLQFRITQENNFRITSTEDSRILEDNSSSGFLNAISNISFQGSITNKVVSNLRGEALLVGTAIVIPYSSTLYAKEGVIWKQAIPYVKVDNLWKTPTYIGIKVNGVWKRVF